MTSPDRHRPEPGEWAGGFIMFLTEALIVLGLGGVALILSTVILAFF